MMMKRQRTLLTLTAISLVLMLGSVVSAANPSPYLKQLRIGCYAYGGSTIWQSSGQALAPTIRQWYAQRYAFAMGSGESSASDLVSMRNLNPEMKALVYSLYLVDTTETSTIRSWCAQKGYNFRDLVLHTKTGAGDSAVCRSNPNNPTGFGRWVTTPPNSPMFGPGFTAAQTRLLWNFRDPRVGEYLGEKWVSEIEALGYDGVFVDEEFIIGYTGNSVSGNFCTQAPFKDTTSDYWLKGGPYDYLPSWPRSMNIVAIRDSLRRARDGWMGTAGSMLKSRGYFYAPNFAAVPVINNPANWDNEGRHASILCGAYVMGEYSYFYPGADGYESSCNTAVKAVYSVKDSAVNIFLGWIRMGQYDLDQGKSYDRSKMNGLGFMLDATYPGSTQVWFSPCVKNGQVDFKMNRETIGSVASGTPQSYDTTTMWCYAWGKYFGIPKTSRDSSVKGTDGAGQGYTVHKVTMGKPTDTAQVQTLAIGRYARGANFDLTSTRVTVAVPTGTWFELNPNATWTRYTNSTIGIGNAEWRVLVSDTTVANAGTTAPTSSDTIPPASVQDLGAVPGETDGAITLTWTAPTDDASNRVAAYDVRYSRSAISEVNWSSDSTASGEPAPKVAGSAETMALRNLTPGAQYYIALKSTDNAGNWSALSNVATSNARITIIAGVDSCVPQPVGPPNGSLVAVARPELTVQNAVCSDSGPRSYTFSIADEPTFSTEIVTSPPVAEGQLLTSWTADDPLTGGKRYYWRARMSGREYSPSMYFDLRTPVYLYPNPVNLNDGGQVTFVSLPDGSSLLVTSMSGETVRRWPTVAGGDLVWDGRNESGNRISSGVYLWYLEGSDTKGKIVIVE